MSMKAKFVSASDGPAYQVLGSTMTVKADLAQTGGVYEMVVCETRRGADVLAHRHPWAESYFMLDGELEIQVGGHTHIATTGDFLTIPSRAVHGFRVLSETARFLHVSVGEGATAAFNDIDDRLPGLAGPEDLPVMLEIAARHGIELVLPSV
jgi:quercetin dioxygenase-like cupin family protein